MIIKFNSQYLKSLFTKIETYCKEPGFYAIEIHKSKSRRSLNQNKYYWGVIITLFAKHTGYTTNESHQELASMFLKYDKDGKTFVRSTAELNTLEFEKYAERCRFFMSQELGAKVPLPNEITEEQWMVLQNTYNF